MVTLTGAVANCGEKMTAERVVKRVYGVKAVANDIEVKLPCMSERSDADIAAAAVHALQWYASVPEDRIQVTVRNGWVTLEGSVDWWYQKDTAERAVRNLVGLKGVTNDVKVKPGVKSADVKDKIEAAFKRSAEIDARRVRVEAHNGTAILSGNVRSWAEREEAERAAWAAPGVAAVENRITVEP